MAARSLALMPMSMAVEAATMLAPADFLDLDMRSLVLERASLGKGPGSTNDNDERPHAEVGRGPRDRSRRGERAGGSGVGVEQAAGAAVRLGLGGRFGGLGGGG